MNGLLVYDTIGAKRNGWFIEKLTGEFERAGIVLRLCITDGKKAVAAEGIDFAIVRTIAPEINGGLERAGIKTFNNYITSSVANDKWETYLLCEKLGIPVMPTYENVEQADKFPCIIKSCNGHGGTEVFRAENRDELIERQNFFKSAGKKFIVQKYCSDPGRDMRVYVMGGKIIASVLRYNPDSFKSNFSLGGKARLASPDASQVEAVEKIAARLKSDYIGVDFIFNDGRWVLNEIEDVVGSRMLYEVTDIDVAAEYCSYILGAMR